MNTEMNNSQLDLLILAEAALAVDKGQNEELNTSRILTPEEVEIPVNLINLDNVASTKTNVKEKEKTEVDKLISSFGELVSKLNTGLASGRVLDRHDLRYVDAFSGEGREIQVFLKLKTFLNDLDDLFESREYPETEKLRLTRQKLSGSAKNLISSKRPSTFDELVAILKQTFGVIHADAESLLKDLKSLNIKDEEHFAQFAQRTNDFANVVALKMECSVSNKIIFEAFSSTLLACFEPYVVARSDVDNAMRLREPDNLINCLSELCVSNPKLFLPLQGNKVKIKNINITKVGSKIQTPLLTCGYCFNKGHVVKDCQLLKNIPPPAIPYPQQFFRPL